MFQETNKYIRYASATSVLVGLLVVVGWVFHFRLFTAFIPDYAPMKMNSAILFIITGIGLYARIKYQQKQIFLLGNIFVFLFGLFTFLEYLLAINFGIDELFITDIYFAPTFGNYPGRMAQATALCFMLMGAAFGGIYHPKKNIRTIAQFALHLITLISFLAIIGYLLGVPAFYQLSSVGAMAIHTALVFGILSFAASLINHDIGLAGLFLGKGIGNIMARKLFPSIGLLIVLLSIGRIALHRYQLVSVEFGIGLFATSFLLVSLFTIWNTATLLNKINARKNIAEESLLDLNKNLERIVAERTSELYKSISRLEQSEAMLWKSEQMLKGIINNTSASVFVKDTEGRYILINAKFESEIGLKNDAAKGKTAFDIFPEEVALNFTSTENEIFSTGKSVTAEVVIPGEDDSKAVITNKFPLFDEQGKIFAICGISTDITDLRKAKTEQEILSIQLQKKNQQLLNFVHITSHNLRSPVSNLNSLLWLYRESETQEEKALLFEKFETVIHNLSATLNELIDALKIQEDTGREREQLYFEDVFKKVKESMAGKILESEAVVSYLFSKAPVIEYPRLYLESILLNLLSNSLKYRSPQRTPVVHAETHFENGSLVLKFSDNGLGIDLKRHKDKLFGLNKTFHRHEDAKGVGLFIVKTQVEAMGGSISAISEVDKGTTFIIRFNKSTVMA